jgi:hypothetical protein
MTHVFRASARLPSSDAGGRASGSAPEYRAGIRGGAAALSSAVPVSAALPSPPSAAPSAPSSLSSVAPSSAGLSSAAPPSAAPPSAAPLSAAPPSAAPVSAVSPSAGRGDRRVWARLLAGFLRRWNRPPPDYSAGERRSSVTDALFLGGIFPPSEEVMGLSLPTAGREHDPDR